MILVKIEAEPVDIVIVQLYMYMLATRHKEEEVDYMYESLEE